MPPQISYLQFIYSHGYIHTDIKPQNILAGLGNNTLTVFIIDFGIAKWYCNPTTETHFPFVHANCTTGTPAFTSINSHLGAWLWCHNNNKSLAYLLVYLSCGSLPWIDSHSTKSLSILRLKQETPLELLCSGLSQELTTLLTYTQTLFYLEEPDYDYI